jgi:hypothetical protein
LHKRPTLPLEQARQKDAKDTKDGKDDKDVKDGMGRAKTMDGSSAPLCGAGCHGRSTIHGFRWLPRPQYPVLSVLFVLQVHSVLGVLGVLRPLSFVLSPTTDYISAAVSSWGLHGC